MTETNDLTSFLDSDTPKRYGVSKIAENEWRDFALYTVESRAIPSMIDGLKPVQRFYLLSSTINSSTQFKKVAAVSGIISDYGYNHGEASAASAGQLLAAEWSNNICLVEGQGSFGTRLVQAAASPRYVKTKVHANFQKYIKDLDLAPEHEDPEILAPQFYIPIIPLVLANGAKGIATGFATTILPRCPKMLAKACQEYIKTGKIKNSIPVKFPHFTGEVEFNETENRFYVKGVFERKTKTLLRISEVPYGYDRETYIKILDKLEEKGDIVSYDDKCGAAGFVFDVKLKNVNQNWTDEKILKEFKLVKPMTENLTVIDHNGKLREYTDERDIIIDFCEFRKTILAKRIETRKAEAQESIRWAIVKMEFIKSVLNDEIIFKDKKKDEVSDQILEKTSAITDDCARLLRLNISSLTMEEVEKLSNELEKLKSEYKFWETTTEKDQFLEDLKGL